jgi:hypothetical protein
LESLVLRLTERFNEGAYIAEAKTCGRQFEILVTKDHQSRMFWFEGNLTNRFNPCKKPFLSVDACAMINYEGWFDRLLGSPIHGRPFIFTAEDAPFVSEGNAETFNALSKFIADELEGVKSRSKPPELPRNWLPVLKK